jgi:glycosyltransferase involved in cell wall biosynthesis
MLHEAKAVIVNAKAVKDDINKFYPDRSCQIFNLPFAPFPFEEWFEDNGADLKAKYNLPEKYFMISNQFWIHKSHVTAFEALSKLEKLTGDNDIHIVCTGKTYDHRFPHYFNDLKTEIYKLGLTDKVFFLGYIPKEEQIKIMCGAVAVLQPTLFEGGPGGGSVYDAVAMGVAAIISDIPVNLEIKEDNVVFFKTGSPEDMAEKMFQVLKDDRVIPDKNILLTKGSKRVEKLGDTLLAAVESALGK